jgi:hypothetical protein
LHAQTSTSWVIRLGEKIEKLTFSVLHDRVFKTHAPFWREFMRKAESALKFPAICHCSTAHTLAYSAFLHKADSSYEFDVFLTVHHSINLFLFCNLMHNFFNL